jgi:rhodanese-related sulfurtransferase
MGPFVPEIISDQLNLVVALILGVGFGFVLEQAGFSSSRRLAGLFYGYDFTVLRVFFTAAVTAMSGVLLLGYFGLLDTDAIFVNPTWLMPAIVGGAIMGIGFILGGYCPGTSVCAAAIGKIDGLFFVGGGLLGVFGFAEIYPFIHDFNDSTSLGPIQVFDSMGISQGLFAFFLIVVAVGAFALTTILEKRTNKTAAPSLTFNKRYHIAAGLGICMLGVLFIFMPDRKTHLLAMVSNPRYVATHQVKYMDVDELAFRIVDHEPNIQMIDIRPADAYAKLSLPGSTNIPLRDLFSKDWVSLLSRRHVKKVIIGDNDSREQSASLLLQELGYENIATLQGGFEAFRTIILSPSIYLPAGTRWDADVARFRESARVDINKMIEERKKAGTKAVKIEKKIQGGC